MRCLDFMKITEILRLKEMNLFTYRDIADSVGCSKTTVGEILNKCKECGLTYESAKSMTQDQINSGTDFEQDVSPQIALQRIRFSINATSSSILIRVLHHIIINYY